MLYEISYLISVLIRLLTRFAMMGRLIHEKDIQYIFIQVTVGKLEDIAFIGYQKFGHLTLFSNIAFPPCNLLKPWA